MKFFARFLVGFCVWGIVSIVAAAAYSNDKQIAWLVAFIHTAPWTAVIILLITGIFFGIEYWDS